VRDRKAAGVFFFGCCIGGAREAEERSHLPPDVRSMRARA